MAFNQGTVVRAQIKLGGHAFFVTLVDAICRTDRLSRVRAHPQTRRDARHMAHDKWCTGGSEERRLRKHRFWGADMKESLALGACCPSRRLKATV